MNRYLAGFIIISALALGSLVVYTKANIHSEKTNSINQALSGFNGPKTPTEEIKKMPEVTELKIEDISEGTGSAVVAGDTAEVNYLGTLLDGTKFDSSYDRNQTFSFKVGAGEVIQGWDQGLVGMKVGGKRKLTIPSALAYGEQGVGSIPANSPLVFVIELISIK